MGQVFQIIRENKNVEEFLRILTENKSDIKEILCIIRHTNGDINVVDSNATFETKCSGSKMLDYLINQDLYSDNEPFEETELEEENDEG